MAPPINKLLHDPASLVADFLSPEDLLKLRVNIFWNGVAEELSTRRLESWKQRGWTPIEEPLNQSKALQVACAYRSVMISIPPAQEHEIMHGLRANSVESLPTTLRRVGEINSNLLKFFSAIEEQYLIPYYDLDLHPILDGIEAENASEVRMWLAQNEFLLDQITTLNLSKKELTFIPLEIELLENLKWLNLSDNRIVSISPNLWLMQLTYLSMGNNQIESWPKDLLLPSLLGLDLSSNPISSLPATLLENLPALEFLNVQKCTSLKKLPEHLNIETIRIKGSGISEVRDPSQKRQRQRY